VERAEQSPLPDVLAASMPVTLRPPRSPSPTTNIHWTAVQILGARVPRGPAAFRGDGIEGPRGAEILVDEDVGVQANVPAIRAFRRELVGGLASLHAPSRELSQSRERFGLGVELEVFAERDIRELRGRRRLLGEGGHLRRGEPAADESLPLHHERMGGVDLLLPMKMS